jgi:hypothetical protein
MGKKGGPRFTGFAPNAKIPASAIEIARVTIDIKQANERARSGHMNILSKASNLASANSRQNNKSATRLY